MLRAEWMYDYYLEKRDLFRSRIDEACAPVSAEKTLSDSERYRKERKEQDTRDRRRKNELLSCEKEIASLEEEIASIDREMEIPEIQVDAERLMALSASRLPLTEKLDALYEKWASLQEETP